MINAISAWNALVLTERNGHIVYGLINSFLNSFLGWFFGGC